MALLRLSLPNCMFRSSQNICCIFLVFNLSEHERFVFRSSLG